MHCKDTNFSWVFGFFGGGKIFFVYLHGGRFGAVGVRCCGGVSRVVSVTME